MLKDHCIFCWQKKKRGFGLIHFVSNSINLRELLDGVCLSWNLPCNLSYWKKNIKKSYGLPKFALDLPLRGIITINHETLSIVCHVDFFIHEVFYGPLDLHLRV